MICFYCPWSLPWRHSGLPRQLPSKIPQLIIFFGLIAVVMHLTAALATERRPWAGPLAALVILGTHGFGIQMGTGMLDLAIIYLFFASLDSLRLGHWFLAGVEFTFFFWSKPPDAAGGIMAMGILAFVFLLACRNQWQIVDTFSLKDWRRAFGLFIVLSVAVGGPFIFKSMHYAGTPFFPLAPGMMGIGGLRSKSIRKPGIACRRPANYGWRAIETVMAMDGTCYLLSNIGGFWRYRKKVLIMPLIILWG